MHSGIQLEPRTYDILRNLFSIWSEKCELSIKNPVRLDYRDGEHLISYGLAFEVPGVKTTKGKIAVLPSRHGLLLIKKYNAISMNEKGWGNLISSMPFVNIDRNIAPPEPMGSTEILRVLDRLYKLTLFDMRSILYAVDGYENFDIGKYWQQYCEQRLVQLGLQTGGVLTKNAYYLYMHIYGVTAYMINRLRNAKGGNLPEQGMSLKYALWRTFASSNPDVEMLNKGETPPMFSKDAIEKNLLFYRLYLPLTSPSESKDADKDSYRGNAIDTIDNIASLPCQYVEARITEWHLLLNYMNKQGEGKYRKLLEAIPLLFAMRDDFTDEFGENITRHILKSLG